jgi:hypothetical protein
MALEVCYFDGCPHWRVAVERLAAAQRATGCRCPVIYRQVRTPEEAEALSFYGSPSILVHGYDPFAAADAPVGLTCRVYQSPDGRASAPSVEEIAATLYCP